jgi:hypothetical protein
MPYFLHLKDTEPESGTIFPTAQSARQYHDPKTQKITFVPDDVERNAWRQREADRFNSGVYFHVPWSDADVHPDHYAHLSTVNAGLVAYTKSEEHGTTDRQTRVKPGKYLEEFYGATDYRTRAIWIGQCAAQHTTLSIARSTADIVKVYLGGPSSCMDAAHMRNGDFDCGNHHPTEPYGNSDLGVAYFGDIDKASARCVVWPDKLLHSRIYGSEHTLQTLLQGAGYTHGSMKGAKIRAIEFSDESYVVPYVDGISNASLSGKWLVLDNRGDIATQTQNGLSSIEDTSETCAHCGDGTYEEGDDSAPYCQSCYGDSSYCSSCEETCFGEGTSTYNGWLCESCADNASKECAVCDEIFLEEAYSGSAQRARRNNGTTDLCSDCAETHTFCSDCDAWYENADHCPDCHEEEEDDTTYHAPKLTPRCEHTADLLAYGPKYIRNAKLEFDGTCAFLMLDAVAVLWYVMKDGSISEVSGNWSCDWKHFLACGAWEYFTPEPSQHIAPCRAHLAPIAGAA